MFLEARDVLDADLDAGVVDGEAEGVGAVEEARGFEGDLPVHGHEGEGAAVPETVGIFEVGLGFAATTTGGGGLAVGKDVGVDLLAKFEGELQDVRDVLCQHGDGLGTVVVVVGVRSVD